MIAAMPGRQATTRHQRTRDDHATEIAEDYCEAIAELADDAGDCRVVDLAAGFGVSHVTVVRTIKRLERDGYVSTAPYKPVRLTPKGRRLVGWFGLDRARWVLGAVVLGVVVFGVLLACDVIRPRGG